MPAACFYVQRAHAPVRIFFPYSLAKERKAADDKPLHPSWEAKRKLKEKQTAGIQAPQGKKIVF